MLAAKFSTNSWCNVSLKHQSVKVSSGTRPLPYTKWRSEEHGGFRGKKTRTFQVDARYHPSRTHGEKWNLGRSHSTNLSKITKTSGRLIRKKDSSDVWRLVGRQRGLYPGGFHLRIHRQGPPKGLGKLGHRRALTAFFRSRCHPAKVTAE